MCVRLRWVQKSNFMGPCLSETELISRFFNFNIPGQWPTQGIGDDCAIIQVGNRRLAVTTDTVASGTHFLPNADPYTIGKKSLAVNLSDLAAAGADPRCFFLALSLPKSDSSWLEAFSRGLYECAKEFSCPLIGGDTTKTAKIGHSQAPFSITITAIGEVERGLTRQGARIGDDIWVSGTVGDAYLALMLRTRQWTGACDDYLAAAMDTPVPRVALGQFLSHFATACADISDGFLKDLGNILVRSNVGAEVYVDCLAVSPQLALRTQEERRRAQLAGGDDYELVWTASESARQRIIDYAQKCQENGRPLRLTRVGKIVSSGLKLLNNNGGEIQNSFYGFDHFAQEDV